MFNGCGYPCGPHFPSPSDEEYIFLLLVQLKYVREKGKNQKENFGVKKEREFFVREIMPGEVSK